MNLSHTICIIALIGLSIFLKIAPLAIDILKHFLTFDHCYNVSKFPSHLSYQNQA
ncbi:cell surface-anchored protein SclH [Streptococcus equi subsp. zooepidemicus ATCC 35246]|nr:cell surface-anchored protein SclH [Streptococcus equi subsp. zooepidemicus ATCC 35246]